MVALRNGDLELEHAAAELRADRDVVLTAINAAPCGSSFKHASAELRADPEFVMASARMHAHDMCMHMYPHVHAHAHVLVHAHVTCITVANVAILGGEAAQDGEIESKSDTQKNSRPSWGHTQEGVPSATGGCAERPVTSKNIVAARRGRSNCYGRYCGPFCEESSNSADTHNAGKLMRIRTFYYLPPKAGFNWRGPARR
jgi:hypothetical protein